MTLEVELSRTIQHPTGLRLPPHLQFEHWVEIGTRLAQAQNRTSWALGDWFFYGEWEYGQRYEEAANVTGLAYQTLADLKYVAGRFEASRRREALSLSHHREVAALPLDEQDRWLDLAEENSWGREALRQAIAASRREALPQARPPQEILPAPDALQLVIDTGDEQLERWIRAAAQAKLDVDVWVRGVCDAAAA